MIDGLRIERQQKGTPKTATVYFENPGDKSQDTIHPVRPLFTLFGRLSWQRRKEESERERGADPRIRQIASINEIEGRIDPAEGRKGEISGFHRSLKRLRPTFGFSPPMHRSIGPLLHPSAIESGGSQLQVTLPPAPQCQ